MEELIKHEPVTTTPYDIEVLSLAQMLDTVPEPKSAILSINDFLQFGENMDNLIPQRQHPNLIGFLPVVFDDLLKSDYDSLKERDLLPEDRTITLFDSVIARQIIMWFASMKEIGAEKIYVHCHAGISRSAAITSAMYFLWEDERYIKYWQSKEHYPNMHVFQSMLKEMGLFLSSIELKRLKDMSANATRNFKDL